MYGAVEKRDPYGWLDLVERFVRPPTSIAARKGGTRTAAGAVPFTTPNADYEPLARPI